MILSDLRSSFRLLRPPD